MKNGVPKQEKPKPQRCAVCNAVLGRYATEPTCLDCLRRRSDSPAMKVWLDERKGVRPG